MSIRLLFTCLMIFGPAGGAVVAHIESETGLSVPSISLTEPGCASVKGLALPGEMASIRTYCL